MNSSSCPKPLSYDPYIGLKSGGKPRVFGLASSRALAHNLYYDSFASYQEIGDHFGTNKTVVKNLFKVMGWAPRDSSAARHRDGRRSAEAFARYTELYRCGHSIDSIAARFKFAPWRLAEHLKSVGAHVDRDTRAKQNIKLTQTICRERQLLREASSPYYGVASKIVFYNAVHYLTRRFTKHLIGPPPVFSYNDIGDAKPVLDHKLSIADAYYTGRRTPVTAYELAHPCNLEYLTPGQNCGKGERSSLKATVLRRQIKQYNAVHGDPFAGVVIKSPCVLYIR